MQLTAQRKFFFVLLILLAAAIPAGCKSWTQFWAPVISGFSPSYGTTGDLITVTGFQFNTNPAGNSIRIGNGVTTAVTASETQLTFRLPAGATTGKIEITAREGTGKSDGDFSVEKYILYVLSNGSTVHGHILDNSAGTLSTISGLPTSPTSNDLVADSQGRYLYLSKGFANNIAGYAIDKTSGFLTTLPGSPFAPIGGQGTETRNIGIDAQDKSIYTHDVGTSEVFRFSLDQKTGALSQQQKFTMASQIANFISDSAARYLYAATANNEILGYSINSTSGALSPLSGSPYTGGASMLDVRLTPDERFAFVTQSAGNSILRFNADMATGILTLPTAAAVGSPFFSIAITSSGKYLFTADSSTTLRSYPIDGSGNFGTANTTVAGSGVRWVRVTPNDKYLFAIQTTGFVSVFAIGSDGSMTAVPGATYATAANALGVIIARVRQ